MSVIQVEGKSVVWEACKKHAEYQDSGYLVLSCKKCVVRLVHLNPDCENGKHPACGGDAWDFVADKECPCDCSCHASVVSGLTGRNTQ